MTKPKLQVFKDEKYIIVEYDALNYAILSLKRFEETQREDRSLIGYYPTLKSAIIRVLEMQIGDQLLEKVRRTGPFKFLDNLVTEYTKNALFIASQVAITIQNHRSTNLE